MKKLILTVLAILALVPAKGLAKETDCMFTTLPVTCFMLEKINELDQKNEDNKATQQAISEYLILAVAHGVDLSEPVGDYLVTYFLRPHDCGENWGCETLERAFQESHVTRITCSIDDSDEPATLLDDKGGRVPFNNTAPPYYKNMTRLICETKAAEIMADKGIFL